MPTHPAPPHSPPVAAQRGARAGSAGDDFPFPLGWGRAPLPTGGWPLSSHDLPHLSVSEARVTAQIRDAYFASPTLQPDPAEFPGLIQTYAQDHAIHLIPDQVRDIAQMLTLLTQGAGPLTPLLAHSALEEIALTGVGPHHPVRVYHRSRGWIPTPLFFTQADVLIALLNRLVRETGKRLTSATPILNAVLPDGSRLHASISPVCSSGVEVSIRKFIVRATGIQDLAHMRVAPPSALSFLRAAIQTDATVLIVGNTGSGKTTTLNALMASLPAGERIILTEETPELQLPHSHVIRLHPDSESNLSLARVIRETLRMRPDRVVIGEIRFPEEGMAFMECVLAGQGKGTYATFHGHSAAEALARLRQFGIPEPDLGWIHVVVVQKRWSVHAGTQVREVRAITEIVELESRDGKVIVTPLFTWDSLAGKLVKRNPSSVIRAQWLRNFPGKKWNG